MSMDDTVRMRMKRAIEMKRLNLYQLSLDCGFSKNYLWESFKPERKKGSVDGFKKIADHIGLSLLWLFNDEGEPFLAGAPAPLDRQGIVAAFEVVLEHCLALELALARDAALKVLDIVEHPPDGRSTTDTKDRIRSGILGALRVYEHSSNQ
jgi:hypothetical protein